MNADEIRALIMSSRDPERAIDIAVALALDFLGTPPPPADAQTCAPPEAGRKY